MKKVVEKRKDIAFYLKLFPLKMHPGSYERAKEIECKRSLALLEDSFNGKPIPKPECAAPEIDQNIKLGQQLGITGTPTIILPDGKILAGYRPAAELIKILDENAKNRLSPVKKVSRKR